MKSIGVLIIAICLTFPCIVRSDTIFLKNGRKIEVESAWEENGNINYYIGDVLVGLPLGSVEKVERKKASEWYELAVECLNNNPRKALEYIEKAISVDPDYARAYTGKGLAHTLLKEYKAAKLSHDKAISLDPDSPKFLTNRSVLFGELSEYDKAVKDCSDAIQLDPEYVKAYTNRGGAYLGLAKIEKACMDFSMGCNLGDCEGLINLQNRGFCSGYVVNSVNTNSKTQKGRVTLNKTIHLSSNDKIKNTINSLVTGKQGYLIKTSEGDVVVASSVEKGGGSIKYTTPNGLPGFIATNLIMSMEPIEDAEKYFQESKYDIDTTAKTPNSYTANLDDSDDFADDDYSLEEPKYQPVSLHRGDISDWQSASYSDKLDASCDMALVSTRIMSIVKSSGDSSLIKKFGFELKTCIDQVALEPDAGSQKVSEVALMCMTLMNW